MPNLGEIRKARKIGYKTWHTYIYATCVDCGKERWIQIVKGKLARLRCHSCGKKGHIISAETRAKIGVANRADKNGSWNGGKLCTIGE